jgi:spoIIIJ-associated protein
MFFGGEKGKIKEIVEKFFDKTGFSVLIEVSNPEEGIMQARIKTDEPKILIGQNGQTLFEIQHLLRIIIKKSYENPVQFDLDINEYKKKKMEYLKETARTVADEVFLSKKNHIFEPMSSYERRVIHLELANRSDVTTESIGEGGERHIMVKAKN